MKFGSRMLFFKMLSILFFFILICQYSSAALSNRTFPDEFVFGVSTASYQIEGAWNEDGKSENIWDYQLHTNPELVSDGTNGDIACDSYHKYKEDVQLLKTLRVNFYRFSVSWTRILPEAVEGSELNEKGVAYYNNLIDELLANDIEPYVTIFHWDTPQILEVQGGWLNETIIDHYVYYARQLFALYGDRVKRWMTFNEPKQTCEQGYSVGDKAPFIKNPGVGGYQCYHHLVVAHAKAYRMYEKEFKSIQKGEVGITIDCTYVDPLTNSTADQEAAEQYMQLNYGWYVHPIILGNYPPIMIKIIDEMSEQEGRSTSRLPKFTEEQIELTRGSFDFLGLNHYTSFLATFGPLDFFADPSHERDVGVFPFINPSTKRSVASWLYETPEGMHNLLVWIKEHYNNPPVLITENGWATFGLDLEDTDRVEYITKYLSEILRAIYNDGCKVIGYTVWSLMDNFEWTAGYTNRLGLVHVDFEDANRTRTPKTSYNVYQNIISTRRLTDN